MAVTTDFTLAVVSRGNVLLDGICTHFPSSRGVLFHHFLGASHSSFKQESIDSEKGVERERKKEKEKKEEENRRKEKRENKGAHI
jgi:hypothetical protein